jgi:hypothetical protein
LGAEISYDGGTTYFNVGSSSNKLYVTYGSPVGALTQKRIEWCTTKANNLSTPGGIADAIWGAVATGTTFGNQNTDGWALLDGGSGDCDNQARLMSYVVKLLGISPANVRLVYASTNAGAGNCLSLESRVVGSQTHYLIMDFDTGSGYGWNAYEGSCETAGAYYAITPKKKADNDYEMLKSINCQQYWVRTNVPPGSASGWTVLEVFEEVPKP